MNEHNRRRALVLSGGGGRGAYHVGVLRFLEEHDWFPDVIVGTSIGAVNGAAVASGHNSRSLWALWRQLKTSDVQKLNLNPLRATSLLDTAPLRQTLRDEGWIDFERVNSEQASVHLRITATEVTTGRLHVFGNSADVYPGRMQQASIELDHIIASCSIPIVYPATQMDGRQFWDGATVANTPLGPAIDAGSEEIIVVLMTPWNDDSETAVETPGSLIDAASTTLEWALLASFQADLKLFRQINELVRLQLENARLRAANQALIQHARGELSDPALIVDEDNDGIPDAMQQAYQLLPDPIIVAPRQAIPVEQIIRYTAEDHEQMHRMGYEDARRAWREAGRPVEGEGVTG